MHWVPLGTSTAEWLTAVGTVGATTLALFGIYRAAWSRPRLFLESDTGPAPNSDQVETVSTSVGTTPLVSTPSAWIRARVRSRRGLAVGAEVAIIAASVDTGSGPRKIHVDGSSLRWSEHDPPISRLDIPPGLARRIDIASVTKPFGPQAQSAAELVLETVFMPNNKSNHIQSGTIALDLAAASSNGPASYYEIVLRFDGACPDGPDGSIWDHLEVVSLKRQRRVRAVLRG